MTQTRITIGFSSHRLETLTAAEEQMRRHATVALEEPPTAGFDAMLAGRLPIEDYVNGGCFEFPIFATALSALLRRVRRRGVQVIQVEPYLEQMARIHELFESGGRPDDIEPGSEEHEVYLAERAWTGALLGYYAAATSDELEHVVPSVLEFARHDASRGRLRDRLRARAIADLAGSFDSMYVEAGYLHVSLLRELRRRLEDPPVDTVWLLGDVVRSLTGRRQLLGPGDLLTLRWTLRPDLEPDDASLLAARSLIHAAMSWKDEVPEDSRPFPHTRHEVEVLGLVSRLSWEDCRRLFPDIRCKKPRQAHEVVQRHLQAEAT